MKTITEKEYNAIPKDYRGVWSTDRSDIPGWKPEDYMGKRTMMAPNNGGLLIEDLHFKIKK